MYSYTPDNELLAISKSQRTSGPVNARRASDPAKYLTYFIYILGTN